MQEQQELFNNKMTMTKNQMSVKNYSLPTPKKWRRIGDSLLAVSAMVTGTAIYNDYEWVAFTALIVGVVGKFLTNFFKEEENEK